MEILFVAVGILVLASFYLLLQYTVQSVLWLTYVLRCMVQLLILCRT